MTEFIGARRKVKRAEKHIADIKTALRTVADSCTPCIEKYPDIGHQAIKYGMPDFAEVKLEMALLIGDAFHNLRTALDHAWAEVIQRHAPRAYSGYNRFPINWQRQKVEAALNGIKEQITSPALTTKILSDIKPYLGGNDYIVGLHYLDIADKHHMLLPTLQVAWAHGIVVEDENGEQWRGGTWVTTRPGPYYLPLEGEIRIKEQGNVSFQILLNRIEHAEMFDMGEVTDILCSLRQGVMRIIEQLETL